MVCAIFSMLCNFFARAYNLSNFWTQNRTTILNGLTWGERNLVLLGTILILFCFFRHLQLKCFQEDLLEMTKRSNLQHHPAQRRVHQPIGPLVLVLCTAQQHGALDLISTLQIDCYPGKWFILVWLIRC